MPSNSSLFSGSTAILFSEPRSIFTFSFVLVNSPCITCAQHTALKVAQTWSHHLYNVYQVSDLSGQVSCQYRLKSSNNGVSSLTVLCYFVDRYPSSITSKVNLQLYSCNYLADSTNKCKKTSVTNLWIEWRMYIYSTCCTSRYKRLFVHTHEVNWLGWTYK